MYQTLEDVIDELSRKYLAAQSSVIAEWAGNIHQEQWTLLHEVNDYRLYADLPPLEAPDHWLPENYFD